MHMLPGKLTGGGGVMAETPVHDIFHIICI